MSIIFRLSNRNLYSKLLHCNSCNFILNAARSECVTLQPKPYKPQGKQSHDEANMKLGRPQSPHLTIYAIQLPSSMSITHRLMGSAMAFYCLSWALAALLVEPPLTDYLDCIEEMDIPCPIIYFTRFVFAFPFCYHFCNGIRHLCWDYGPGSLLTMKAVYMTGYIVLAIALGTTCFLVFV